MPNPLTQSDFIEAVRDGTMVALRVEREYAEVRRDNFEAALGQHIRLLRSSISVVSFWLSLCFAALCVIAWRVW